MECACKDNSVGGVSFLVKEEENSPYEHFSKMSATDVTNWLGEIGLEEYAATFRENNIDGECLKLFRHPDGEAFLREMIPRVGPRMKFSFNLKSLVAVKRSPMSTLNAECGQTLFPNTSTITNNDGQPGTEFSPFDICSFDNNAAGQSGSEHLTSGISTSISNDAEQRAELPPPDIPTLVSNGAGLPDTELSFSAISLSVSNNDGHPSRELLPPDLSVSFSSSSGQPDRRQTHNTSLPLFQQSSDVLEAGQERDLDADFTSRVCDKELKIILHPVDEQRYTAPSSDVVSISPSVTISPEPSTQQQSADISSHAPTLSAQQDNFKGNTSTGTKKLLSLRKSSRCSGHLSEDKHIHTRETGERPCDKYNKRSTDLCKQLCKHKRTLSKVNVSETSTRKYSCVTCGKEFTRQKYLALHQRIHTGEKPFSCETCGKRFTASSNLIVHKRIHTGEKPYSCDKCGKKFSQLGNLSRHKRVHSGERPFSCNICGVAFSQQGPLTVHKRIHTCERINTCICETCGKGFKCSSYLKVHQRIHTGEKPFSCTTCKKAFRTASDLRVHKRRHTGERPFSCETCQKKFVRGYDLTLHKRIHSGKKPFSCDICLKNFYTSSNLTAHKWIHRR